MSFVAGCISSSLSHAGVQVILFEMCNEYYHPTVGFVDSGVSSGVMFPGGSSDTLSFDFVTFERCWPPFMYPTAQCSGSNFGTSDCECPAVEDNDTLDIPHFEHDDFSCRCKGGKYLASEYQFNVFYNTPSRRLFSLLSLVRR